MKNNIIVKILLLITVIIALLELVLYIINFPTHTGFIYKLDKTLGYTFKPNSKLVWYYEGNVKRFKTNPYGLLFRKSLCFSKLEKILVLGDGYCSSLELKNEDTFYHFLKIEMPNFAFLNACVPGYGTTQEAILLEKMIKNCFPIRIVIIFFNLDNDFINNSKKLNKYLNYAHLYPYYDNQCNLEKPKITSIDRIKKIFQKYRFYNLISRLKKMCLVLDNNWNRKQQKRIEISKQATICALKRIKQISQNNNFYVIIYGISLKFDKNSFKAAKLLKDICKKLNIPCFINFEINKKWLRRKKKLVFSSISHPNKLAHRLIYNDLIFILRNKIGVGNGGRK